MIVTLKQRIIDLLADQISDSSTPIFYGHPRTREAKVYIVISGGTSEITQERLGAGRSRSDEEWEITIRVISDAHHDSIIKAEHAVDSVAQEILDAIARYPRLETESDDALAGLRHVQATGYEIESGESDAEGVISSATITLLAITRELAE